jgi:hypothetical protein
MNKVTKSLIHFIYQEAIVVVLDVNHTMQKNLGEGDQSRFEVALDSIKMLIEQKVTPLNSLHYFSFYTRLSVTSEWF